MLTHMQNQTQNQTGELLVKPLNISAGFTVLRLNGENLMVHGWQLVGLGVKGQNQSASVPSLDISNEGAYFTFSGLVLWLQSAGETNSGSFNSEKELLLKKINFAPVREK